MQEMWVQPLGQEDPLKEETPPGLLPGKSHRQRSLAGYSPGVTNMSDTTYRLNNKGAEETDRRRRRRRRMSVQVRGFIWGGQKCSKIRWWWWVHNHVPRHAKSLRSCLTLCDLMVCSPPGHSVHGILQARILEWVAMPFSKGSSWPRDLNSCLLQPPHCSRILYSRATREACTTMQI